MIKSEIEALLSDIPKDGPDLRFIHRMPLEMITADGRKFTLSIQASEHMYCSPRETLDNLMEYTDVEMAVIAEERREDGGPKWLKLEDVGIPLEADFQDVYPYVNLKELITALQKFFWDGGKFTGYVVPEDEVENGLWN